MLHLLTDLQTDTSDHKWPHPLDLQVYICFVELVPSEGLIAEIARKFVFIRRKRCSTTHVFELEMLNQAALTGDQLKTETIH